jgi:hypothetical protein
MKTPPRKGRGMRLRRHAMTKYDAALGRRAEESGARLEAEGLYRAEDERDACGVGFVVTIDGKPRRQVVEKGIRALKAIWHRGAVDADGKTGDGAGIHVQIPGFFEDQVRRTGHEPRGEAARGRAGVPAAQRFRARRRRRGPSWRPKCCAWATTSTAGGTCRWTSPASARRRTRRGPRSSRS